jgi:NAD(P)-dependent dehydrogenase (short-subunit alcohol dehydrogenase family)
LADLVEEAGGGIAFAADVSAPDDTIALAEAARRELGAVDLFLSTVGVAPLNRFSDTTAEDWEHTFATNVIGIHQTVRHLLPVMVPGGIMAIMSSEVVGRPRSGLGAYGASKAALEAMVEQWRVENPGTRFSTIQIGSCVPTEFGVGFDLDLLTTLLNEWAEAGLAQTEFMDVGEVGKYLVDVYAAQIPFPGICMEHVVVRSPSGVTADADAMVQHAESTIPPAG